MNTFLDDVVKFILSNHSADLKDSCIVFPNRRSAIYFFESVKKINTKVIWLPKHFTIDDFIHSIVNQRIAMPITQLSLLYRVYQKLTKTNETFDRFFQWAQVILSDFEDIDKYLVDAHSILLNIQDIKELDDSIDYLTDEQRSVVKKFFHIALDDKSKLREKFLNIWHVLLPMYELFNQELANQQLTYNGAVYRKAAQRVEAAECDLPYSKIFFVGFNAITNAERHIFRSLKQQDKAVFFWDYDVSYINNPLHEAGRFLRDYVKEFPEPENFQTQHNFDFKSKNINIIASPTISGQFNVVAKKLTEIPADEISSTALVLSDETQLTSVLEHVSPYLSDLNVTMGYKIRNSIAGQWIEQLLQLQANVREHQGEKKFYYKNVLGVLQHPFFMAVSEDFATDLSAQIKKDAIFQLPITFFDENDFAKLVFQIIDNQKQFTEYLLEVLKTLSRWFTTVEGDAWLIQQELVYRLTLQIQQFSSELAIENLQMEMPTYYQLLRNYLNSAKVPFEGEPILGLQVMGFLETRNVDLKNVIVLNVNEETLPANGNAPTFIPFSLRRGFSLPTHDEREAMYAYYFYRLLQRAENITLTYFTGKIDGKEGECSRYIMQLLYGDFNVKFETLQSNINFDSKTLSQVEKNGVTAEKLAKFYKPDAKGSVVTLSPSSIVKYQMCPLMFYFKNILQLTVDEDIDEDIDNRRFGNIFHKAAQMIYSQFIGKGKTSEQQILSLIGKCKKQIDLAFVDEVFPFNKELLISKIDKNAIDIRENLKSDQRIIYDVIDKYIAELLRYDANIAKLNDGIEFISLEQPYTATLKIATRDGEQKIKVGGTIDRVDNCGGAVRIVDYKTGTANFEIIEKDGFEGIFDTNHIDKYKGALQTLIYCMAYDGKNNGNQTIEPYLYKITALKKGDSFNVHVKGNGIFADGNYITIKEQVIEKITGIVSEIFDCNTPFKPTTVAKTCSHCEFSYFCNKQL